MAKNSSMREQIFWDRLSGKLNTKRESHEITVNKINSFLNKDDEILDFGCAAGLITNDIAKNVKWADGIDISPKLVEAANKNANEEGIENATYFSLDLFNENLKKESYNVIMAINVIHFLKNSDDYIQRFYDLLKPGGIFISLTVAMKEEFHFTRISIPFLGAIGVIPKMHYYNKNQLKEITSSNGFKILDIEEFNFTKYPQYFIAAQK
ncbi:MAG: class I SAM-dependent methyltransferase [Spirochaetales bacterium]|nr:class I SAM-dependent methyltransferase [Spirochaetales bacterium]